MEATFNYWEAGLWIVISVVLCLKALAARGHVRRVLGFLSMAFLLFAASDLIEARTGSWWEPWWLAVLKVACVAAMIMGFRRYYLLTRSQRPG